MPRPLYSPLNRAITLTFSELETYALGQREVFVGTAGSVLERSNASGFRFYAHQYYDGTGKKRERYVAGPIGDATADTIANELRERISELKELTPALRLVGREGCSVVDAKTFATVAALHSHGLFAVGAMLIGSHAYGVLLNRLGARAVPYVTQDVDIARGQELLWQHPPRLALGDMLNESGVEFVAVPPLDRKFPSTSFKQRGRSPFHVDLLAPARGEQCTVVAAPEIKAHATGLPYLGYLLAESQSSALLARTGCCAVRVPVPERFAVHKLLVSQLRTGRQAKSARDLTQAAVLCAVLADTHSGALEAAVAAVPKRARMKYRAALDAVRPRLEADAPRALEELGCNPW